MHHTACNLLRFMFFTQHNFLEFTGCGINRFCVPFYCRVVFRGTDAPQFNHLSVGGLLACLRFGVIMNKSAINICVLRCQPKFHFPGVNAQECNCWVPWSVFQETAKLSSRVAASFYSPSSQYGWSCFSTLSLALDWSCHARQNQHAILGLRQPAFQKTLIRIFPERRRNEPIRTQQFRMDLFVTWARQRKLTNIWLPERRVLMRM